MDKLIYGNGNCSISSSEEVRGVEIHYKGAINIVDKTPEGFNIIANENKIIIFPLGEGGLSDLFNYQGELRIMSVIVASAEGKKIPVAIKRVMDYAELLNTKAEDMTTNSEKLNSTYKYANKVEKTRLNSNIIANLNTSDWKADLYLENGAIFNGKFHIHKSNNKIMTGAEHTDISEELFYKKKDSDKLTTIITRNETTRSY